LGNYFNIAGQHAILRHKLIKKVKFGIHDLSKDAPFQKFDIILCRNVFIYYQPFFQKKLLSCIVASMKKESYLGLSPSENIEESGEALGLICFDRHLNIYKSGNSCKEESKNVKLPQL
nr:CheR family methyltransferase [Leptospiraceae bacterium]